MRRGRASTLLARGRRYGESSSSRNRRCHLAESNVQVGAEVVSHGGSGVEAKNVEAILIVGIWAAALRARGSVGEEVPVGPDND
ncbi:hypothetical protein U1Q18_007497 [Sarracenia purpurea var. burkii]